MLSALLSANPELQTALQEVQQEQNAQAQEGILLVLVLQKGT